MKKIILAACLAFAGAAVAQDEVGDSPAAATPPAGAAATGAAAKTEAAKPAGPDVSKMPFTSDSIKSVVAHYQPQIQSCYNETLAGRRNVVEGKLMTSFVITGEGLVKKPKVLKKGTTVKDPKLNDCVVAVLAAMEFPKPPDKRDQPIEYPFNLKAEK